DAQSNALSAHKTALGYLDNATAGLPSFGGQPMDATSLLIGYVYSGDANLDGTVDTIDFNNLASNFSGSGKFWGPGDFNYDGSIDTVDFNLLASNFSLTLAATAPSPVGEMIPEPTISTLLTLAGAFIAARRRRVCGI